MLTAHNTYHIDRSMTRERPKKAVLLFCPRPHQLLAIIRRLATDSSKVFVKNHASERMEERGITRLDAIRALKAGDIVGDIEAGANSGEWKCKVVERRKGARALGVVTIVVNQDRLFIKTVEWEDR